MSALNFKAQPGQAGCSAEQSPEPSISASKQAEEVWLGIHFPDISLNAHQALDSVPFAVLELQQGKNRVHCMNSLAQQRGLEMGMLSSAAYALCQDLRIAIRDEGAELQQLQAYVQRVMHFTPRIVLSKPDTLLLEVRASLKLFGGMQRLHRQLKEVFTEIHSIACAPAVDAAELMARHAISKRIRNPAQLRAVLGEIMLVRTPIRRKLVQKLARCGLLSLRDLWRLPRPDLARRFGDDVLRYLDQLSGQCNAPRRLFERSDSFKAKYDFEQETGDKRCLLYAAELLLKQARIFLQTRASLSEKSSFRFIYARLHRTSELRWMALDVHAQQGGDCPEDFLPQLGEQLQNLQFEGPLSRIELRIKQFRPRTDSTYDLFKKSTVTSDSWPVLLDLLFARLGHKYVYRLTVVADHRPEKAWKKRPVQGVFSVKQGLTPCSARPTWLFRQARKCPGQRFRLISGAERLESGWWEEADARREYYQGIAPSGRRCWLYRDLQAHNEQWYLHGLFA